MIHERASHSRVKIFKEVTTKDDHKKAAELRGVYSSVQTEEQEMNGQPLEAPRQVLIPAATLEDPAAAEAVFNTLTLPDAPDQSQQEADMDEATAARAAELQERETEIGLQLRDGSITDVDEWQRRQHEMLDIKRLRLQLEDLLSDDEWHQRAATAAGTRTERLVDILADLVAQRWPDFPFRIDWPRRLDQMVEAYRGAGRSGRDLLEDVLTASVAVDKNHALVLLTARWLAPTSEDADDDSPPQALHQLPAGEDAAGVLSEQKRQIRPRVHLHGVPQGEEEAVLPEGQAEAEGADSIPPAAPPVPALHQAKVAEPVLFPQPASGRTEPAVPSVS